MEERFIREQKRSHILACRYAIDGCAKYVQPIYASRVVMHSERLPLRSSRSATRTAASVSIAYLPVPLRRECSLFDGRLKRPLRCYARTRLSYGRSLHSVRTGEAVA
ncbi:hypothetical protein EVAR_20797_1 [Eumeta japonica]|uniref:Uncharacterized protein n=1 Tax=Eumeta variegata TaxID=151549 RepID=A0A4C1UDB9_EUMVA|nr:hypothetical protein EVAR_20797_1 [Eumeta japonica]